MKWEKITYSLKGKIALSNIVTVSERAYEFNPEPENFTAFIFC
jgi:hypothetical protein